VLQCVAVCCSVLQCVAVCCSVLQRVAACDIHQTEEPVERLEGGATNGFCIPTFVCMCACVRVRVCVCVCVCV